MPRLPRPPAERLLDGFLENNLDEWPGFDASNLPEPVRFAATGGSTAATDQLDNLREALLEIAESNGMGTTNTQNNFARFDSEAAIFLARLPLFSSGEALRDDVWAFVAICLAPDIVHWRFSGTRERYLGGIRNAFQRLWVRARALDRGKSSDNRWGLLEDLTEDALVQITERPSLGNHRHVARELAEAWARASNKFGRPAMEILMRMVALRLRVLNEIRDLASLDHSTMTSLLDSMFDLANIQRNNTK